MAIDGGLRPLFRKAMPLFHWQSIETGGTGKGIPDSNYCRGGVEGWVEFKITKGWTAGLRPEQVGWHLKRQNAGGRTFIAIRQQLPANTRRIKPTDRLWLFPGYMVKALEEGIPKHWWDEPPEHVLCMESPWKWELVEDYLLGRW
jgi:hypothetical protein